MTDTSIIISFIDADSKARTKSVTNINSEVNQEDLINFSKKYIGLTENSYVSTTRIDRIKLD